VIKMSHMLQMCNNVQQSASHCVKCLTLTTCLKCGIILKDARGYARFHNVIYPLRFFYQNETPVKHPTHVKHSQHTATFFKPIHKHTSKEVVSSMIHILHLLNNVKHTKHTLTYS